MTEHATERPFTLTIAALGGQGGGVVQGWMIDVAERSGLRVQATSVPGVAQRTGATIYYLEFVETKATPVMALMPASGNCDLIVASELAEAVRMVERRLVDPEITTVVTSTHRAFTIDERSHRSDGRADSAELFGVLGDNAARVLAFDMEQIALEHGSVISAAILGGIAGADVLPFEIDAYRAAIRHGGRGVEQSLAAFEAALDATQKGVTPMAGEIPQSTRLETSSDRFAHLPGDLASVLDHAVQRLADYQDAAYVEAYLAKLEPYLGEEANADLAIAVATGLALWMTFEDTIRVADLKTRPDRLMRLMEAPDGSVAYVSDYMKPRVEEIAGTMPVSLGRWVEQSPSAAKALAVVTKGLTIRSTNVFGYMLLRCLARLRRWRRRTLRYGREMAALDEWLANVGTLAATDTDAAIELARCQSLVSGYGDSHARGLAAYRRLAVTALAIAGREGAANTIAQLREVALGGEDGLDGAPELRPTDEPMQWETA